MNKIVTLSLAAIINATSLVSQTQITNGGFENWGNASPGNANEPTSWYSNKSGSNIAQLGPQTCFKCTSPVHSGNACVRVQTESYIGTAVNGVVTTGVVDAPSLTKSDGYCGTVNYSTSSDDRRMAFTGRPDSITGWYQYSPGGTGEQGKVRVILHTGDYYDPETPTTNHPDPTANRIADTTFYTPTAAVSTWTRFSLPFNYFSTNNPTYIMINITASANQSTSVTGSQMWLDDIAVVYNTAGINQVTNTQSLKAYYSDKTVYVDLQNSNNNECTLSIFNLTGKLMSSEKLESNKLNTLNVSRLNSGMYLYQIVGSTSQKTGKFIVE